MEELLSISPDSGGVSVLQLQQARHQIVAESFRCLSWKKSRKMVDRDDGKWWSASHWNWDCWLVEGGVDAVDWDWVVGVGGIAADINDNGQVALLGLERIGVDKWWNLGGQVDAVDENVGLDNLLEWATLCGLGHIPLDDILVADSGLDAHINGTASTASKSTNDKNTRLPSDLSSYTRLKLVSASF